MPKRQCKAIAKRSGKQCTKSAIRGGTVLSPTGRRSQVKAAAAAPWRPLRLKPPPPASA